MSESTTESTVPTIERDSLNDLAKMFLAMIEEQAADYNARAGKIAAATGDSAKAVHDLRETSDDAKVVKFREFIEALDAKREKAVADIDAYISSNLLESVSLTEEQIEAEREALKELKSQINTLSKSFTALPAVGKAGESLLPTLKGSRASVSKGTGAGSPKPRVTGVYVDGVLASHEVTKDGETVTKSTFTDAVKVLSEAHKVKVNVSDLHAGWFETAKVTAENWSDAPDSTEYVVSITDKDGKSHNHTILVTK